eukprot:5691150-Alexandrium_andersonii.AAC.1
MRRYTALRCTMTAQCCIALSVKRPTQPQACPKHDAHRMLNTALALQPTARDKLAPVTFPDSLNSTVPQHQKSHRLD